MARLVDWAQLGGLKAALRGERGRRLIYCCTSFGEGLAVAATLLSLSLWVRAALVAHGAVVRDEGLPGAASRLVSQVLGQWEASEWLAWGWVLPTGGLAIWTAVHAFNLWLAAGLVSGLQDRLLRTLYRQLRRLSPPLAAGGRDEPEDTARRMAELDVELQPLLAANVELRHRVPILLAVLFVLAFVAAPRAAALATLVGLASAAAWRWGQHRLRSALERHEHALAKQRRLLGELLAYVPVVKAWILDEYGQRRFEGLLEEVSRCRQRGWFRQTMADRIGWAVGAVAGVILLVGLGSQIRLHSVALDELWLAVTALVAAAGPLRCGWKHWQRLHEAADFVQDLAMLMEQEPAVLQRPDARFLDPLSRQLRFRHVTVRRGGRTLLNDFHLSIEAGGLVAILSPDRGTYRAIAFLLGRLIDPDEGAVLIDGCDLREATLESIRANVGLALDGYYVVTDTVRANIAGGEERPLPELVEAAKRAHVHSFVQRMPNGYDTVVGPLGTQLTIGEQYRLALARLILQNPALAVIEEPLQPMDEESRQLVDDTLRWFCRDRTVLFLARRISTLKGADAVVLVRDGKIEAIGTHERLTAESEFYRHIQYALGQRYRLAASLARS